jgi:hypothetical protein
MTRKKPVRAEKPFDARAETVFHEGDRNAFFVRANRRNITISASGGGQEKNRRRVFTKTRRR